MFAGRVFRFDSVLFFSTGIILLCGVFILFSASGGSTRVRGSDRHRLSGGTG